MMMVLQMLKEKNIIDDYSAMIIWWQPDPLTESLDAVIGHNAVLDGKLDTDQPDNEVI